MIHDQNKRRRGRRKMMNVLGLSLLVTSLAAAAIFSPNPNPKPNPREDQTIVKEGHRVVVVEYDQDGGLHNTKISISPPEPDHTAKDKMNEAASVLPNLASKDDHVHAPFLHAPNPKELICDAYGKCKHKIADAMEKTKEAAHQFGETAYDKARDVHDYTKDTAQKAKEHIESNVSEARDNLRNVGWPWMKSQLINSLMGVAYLLAFATAYGMCVWVTFISSYLLARAMPRQQFAVVQSKIYPVYFRAMAYSIAIALFGHLLAHTNTLLFLNNKKPESLQTYNLLTSLFTLFLNSLYLEPRATKLMFERIKIEKEEGRGREDISGEPQRTADPKEPSTTTQRTDQDAVRSRMIKLNDRLKKLNSYSSILNILNLMSLTWHLVYLAQRAHHAC